MENPVPVIHVSAATGRALWGPGDRYTFLVTGAESEGAYFVLEATVAPGGGPPPHIHHREAESFYLLEGTLTVTVGERTVRALRGDFVHIPRTVTHGFHNDGAETARMLAIFAPAGMEGWFVAACDPAGDRTSTPPPATEEMITRMLRAGPEYGVEWVIPMAAQEE